MCYNQEKCFGDVIMQKILGYMRKAIQNYGLISDGDRILVGVSGGKDSLVLLDGLVLLRRFIGIDYDVVAVTLDMGFTNDKMDFTPIVEHCEKLGVEYHIIKTQIAEIVFDVRKEPSPCSLCARMRRGALHDAANDLGCNKVALGHNYDDAVETFVMNLFTEGRIGCFAPSTYLTQKKVTVIRPLVLAPEKEIRRAARKNELPVVKSVCPADGHTNRKKTKDFLADMERSDHGFKDRLFGAMKRANVDGWGGINWTPPAKKD
jgi:tRNA(Ile)-lysidine synthase TilS/MesJ